MHTLRFLFALTSFLANTYGDFALGFECDLNQKQIVYSYTPQICLVKSCATNKKIIVLGNTISSYFKKSGLSETFRSAASGDVSGDDVAVGFIYELGSTIDALHDRRETEGIRWARTQLSPGSEYTRYTLRATRNADLLVIEDLASINLAYIGELKVEITESISTTDCRSCQVHIVIVDVHDRGARSMHELTVNKCEVQDMQ